MGDGKGEAERTRTLELNMSGFSPQGHHWSAAWAHQITELCNSSFPSLYARGCPSIPSKDVVMITLNATREWKIHGTCQGRSDISCLASLAPPSPSFPSSRFSLVPNTQWFSWRFHFGFLPFYVFLYLLFPEFLHLIFCGVFHFLWPW